MEKEAEKPDAKERKDLLTLRRGRLSADQEVRR